jgi:hypothetical protein
VSWFNDWEESAKRPWRTLAFSFVTGFLASSLYVYFRERNIWVAVVVGVGIGTLLCLLSRQAMRDPQNARKPRLPRVSGLELLCGGVGLGLVVVGVTRGSSAFVYAGLPLAALAATWYLIKRTLARRR